LSIIRNLDHNRYRQYYSLLRQPNLERINTIKQQIEKS